MRSAPCEPCTRSSGSASRGSSARIEAAGLSGSVGPMRVAVVGATGAVGHEMLRILEERSFPLDELVLFSSGRSAGKRVRFRGDELTVQELRHDSLRGLDVALLSAGGSVSREVVP